jgi:hypothetical protein
MLSKMLLVVVLGGVTANRPEGPIARADKRDAEPEVGDLSGYYTCRGEEANGKKYSGIAVITKKNDVYLVQWMVGSSSTFTGIGVRQGTTFAASWAMTTEKGLIRGVNLYRAETGPTGPRLVGRWATLPGNGATQTETLTFLKALDPEED